MRNELLKLGLLIEFVILEKRFGACIGNRNKFTSNNVAKFVAESNT